MATDWLGAKGLKCSEGGSPYVHHKIMADESITLQIFDLVERDSRISQNKIVMQTGLATGLVHSFMSRILAKGWVKAKKVSAKRWGYFITPEGFVEKSRLVIDYFNRTLYSYRLARDLSIKYLEICSQKGFGRLVVAGDNEFSDIAILHIQVAKGFVLEGVLSSHPEEKVGGAVRRYKYADVTQMHFDNLWVCDLQFAQWYQENPHVCPPNKITYIEELLGFGR